MRICEAAVFGVASPNACESANSQETAKVFLLDLSGVQFVSQSLKHYGCAACRSMNASKWLAPQRCQTTLKVYLLCFQWVLFGFGADGKAPHLWRRLEKCDSGTLANTSTKGIACSRCAVWYMSFTGIEACEAITEEYP